MKKNKFYTYKIFTFYISMILLLIGCQTNNKSGSFLEKKDSIDNNISNRQSNISGHVSNQKITNSTIEILDVHGNVLKVYNKVTDEDGYYSIDLNESLLTNDSLIIKAYGGSINDNIFNGEFFSFYIKDTSSKINLTPISTILVLLSTKLGVGNTDFKSRINEAKSLMKLIYNLADSEFSNKDEKDYIGFDVEKFKYFVKETSFNSVIELLANDIIDSYADNNETKAIFPNSITRYFRKDLNSRFNLDSSLMSRANQDKLQLNGVSIVEDDFSGTTDKISDVIATQNENIEGNAQSSSSEGTDRKKIIFRSFNIGKWSDSINEETTLLSRIFIDLRLSNLTKSVKEFIANKLKDTNKDSFDKAIMYQSISITSSIVTSYYIELLEGLRSTAISYIPNNDLKQFDISDSPISKLAESDYFNKLSDENNSLNLGLLKVILDSDGLSFSNYLKVNYGLRASEIDNANQLYKYPIFDFGANIISPAKTNIVGGLYRYFTNKFTSSINNINNKIGFDNGLLDESISFDNVSNNIKLEVYKWQWGYPTFMNIIKGLELIADTAMDTKNFTSNFKINNIYNKIMTYASILNSTLTLSEILSSGYYEFTKTKLELSEIEQDEFTNFKRIFTKHNKDFENLHNVISATKIKLNIFLEKEGHIFGDSEDWGVINKIAGTKSEIPKYMFNNSDNGFQTKMEGLINSEALKEKNKIKTLASFNAYVINKHIDSVIAKKKLIDNNESDVDIFNKEYGEYFSFSQMHYIFAYKTLFKKESNNPLYKISNSLQLPQSFIDDSTVDLAINKYIKIMTRYIGSSNNKINLSSIFRNKLLNIKKLNENLKFMITLLSKEHSDANIKKEGINRSWKSIADFLIKTNQDLLTNIEPEVLNSAVTSLLSGKTIEKFSRNYIDSFIAGNFLTPNKQYFNLTKSNGDIVLHRPSLTIAGIENNRLQVIQGFSNIFNSKNINYFYLVAIDNLINPTYKPSFNIFLSQLNNDNLKHMLSQSDFKDNIFMKCNINVEKSNNNKTTGEFSLIDSMSTKDITITPTDLDKVKVIRGNNNLYTFNIIELINKKSNYNISISNVERGVYRDYIDVEVFQPTDDNFSSAHQTSMSNYIYKAQNAREIGKNIVIEKVIINNNEWVRIINNNSFGVFLEIDFQKDDYDNSNRGRDGDYYIASKEVYTFPIYYKFLDKDKKHNNVKFLIYDEIVQDFLFNNNFPEPRIKRYSDNNNSISLDTLLYKVDLVDLVIKKYLHVQIHSNLMSKQGEIIVITNDSLDNENLNKIRVYDEDLKDYIPSSEFTITTKYIENLNLHQIIIKINKYQNNHDYKIVFPLNIKSEAGFEIFNQLELGSFIYYNQAPIAKAGDDLVIIKGENVINLNGEASIDNDGEIVSYQWFNKDNLPLGEGVKKLLIDLPLGENIITLVVTDNNDQNSSDTIKVTLVTPSISQVRKTGQTESYDEDGYLKSRFELKDDGFYQKGLTSDYSRDNENEIVTDNLTKLMWTDREGREKEVVDFLNAEAHCSQLILGGHNDWRLPSINEHQAIIIDSKNAYTIDTDIFNSYYTTFSYWSSTKTAFEENKAWVVSLRDSTESRSPLPQENYVRCVRTIE